MKTVFFSAGDVSGDLHAGALAQRLRERWPELHMLGMGGAAMAAAGVEIVAAQNELAIGGLFEVTKSAGRIARVWRRLGRELRSLRPDLVVLVDSGGFNLPFARRVRQTSAAPILYFVPPQAWAWRRGRARRVAQRVDCVAAILPFEVEVYRAAGVRTEFVGHPSVDRMRALRARVDHGDARARFGLQPEARVIALFPGSRRNELTANLPLQLETARRLHAELPEVEFALAVAPSFAPGDVQALIRRTPLPATLRLECVHGRSDELLIASDAALVKPGTATLEAMLVDTPMVVMGRGNPVSAALVRRLVRVPHFAMPNLLADGEIVPEFLQEEARPEAMAAALRELLGGGAAKQRAGFEKAIERLGGGGAVDRVAALAEALVRERVAAA